MAESPGFEDEYPLKAPSSQGSTDTGHLCDENRDRKGTIVAMKIALGADHAGYELKDRIKEHLAQRGIEVQDEGTTSSDSVDYPDFARKVADAVVDHRASLGILVCGTGIGMAMSANKVPGIRAANCDTLFEAQMSREHNDANVLALGARVLEPESAFEIVDLWIHTAFQGGRHQRRVDKIHEIEKQEVKRLT
jgi:ribose 5-phosphate isomerase B